MKDVSSNDLRLNKKALDSLQANLSVLFESVSEAEWMQNKELKSQTIKLKELSQIIKWPKMKGVQS